MTARAREWVGDWAPARCQLMDPSDTDHCHLSHRGRVPDEKTPGHEAKYKSSVPYLHPEKNEGVEEPRASERQIVAPVMSRPGIDDPPSNTDSLVQYRAGRTGHRSNATTVLTTLATSTAPQTTKPGPTTVVMETFHSSPFSKPIAPPNLLGPLVMEESVAERRQRKRRDGSPCATTRNITHSRAATRDGVVANGTAEGSVTTRDTTGGKDHHVGPNSKDTDLLATRAAGAAHIARAADPRIVYWNAGGISRKTQDVRTLVQSQSIHIALLGKTKLRPKQELRLPNVFVCRRHKVSSRGIAYRSTAILVQRDVVYGGLELLNFIDIRTIGVRMGSAGIELRLFTVYHPLGSHFAPLISTQFSMTALRQSWWATSSPDTPLHVPTDPRLGADMLDIVPCHQLPFPIHDEVFYGMDTQHLPILITLGTTANLTSACPQSHSTNRSAS
ncbi:hypothetical protein EVAR_17059_1 [Eumeta japonica]|uniref:Uncharacterized protein n=1 Tax=Eumeta variegata TaxID=151549 RepID=A0A4C1V639_EUMVA|nr:hypothetical protein EVAR_17059_1 [Eumeta japonica]